VEYPSFRSRKHLKYPSKNLKITLLHRFHMSMNLLRKVLRVIEFSLILEVETMETCSLSNILAIIKNMQWSYWTKKSLLVRDRNCFFLRKINNYFIWFFAGKNMLKYAIAERNVMQKCNSPFIVKMIHSF